MEIRYKIKVTFKITREKFDFLVNGVKSAGQP